MKDKSQQSVRKALNRLERHYGTKFTELFKSITCDNGTASLDSQGICKSCRNKGFGTQLYYAHPYCASERGSNENANRLIRRFLPKGTELSVLTQRDLDHLAMWMNQYPRKLLDGRSSWPLAKVYSFHFNRILAKFPIFSHRSHLFLQFTKRKMKFHEVEALIEIRNRRKRKINYATIRAFTNDDFIYYLRFFYKNAEKKDP